MISNVGSIELIEAAVESSVAGIIITDLSGLICYANPSARETLECTTEIGGKRMREFFVEGAVEWIGDLTELTNTSDKPIEFVLKKSDGNSFTVEITSAVVRNSDGEPIGRLLSFVDVSRRKKAERESEILIGQLRDALDRIKVLRGLIPICAWCKKIRNDDGYWEQVEVYVQQHSEAHFSHGICPDCVERVYPELPGLNERIGNRSSANGANRNRGGSPKNPEGT